MASVINLERIRPLHKTLIEHPIYSAIQSKAELRCFMGHHFFAVWDFMTLVKYLQQSISPSKWPWRPYSKPEVCRFINEIVLEEESGPGLPDDQGQPTYISHFELYCRAMGEVDADILLPALFTKVAQIEGFAAAIASGFAPPAACQFMKNTFQVIQRDQPHQVAAVFAFGREDIIPKMFLSVLKNMNVTEAEAPSFHYYLNRHIHIDQDSHSPLAMLMLEELCQGDAKKLEEAEKVAYKALNTRIELWDGVYEAMKQVKIVEDVIFSVSPKTISSMLA